MWSANFEMSILPEILRISFRFQFYQIKIVENHSISGTIKSTKKTDHNLEFPKITYDGCPS